MVNKSYIAIIGAIITFIYSIPVLINPDGQTVFSIVSAVICVITGLCLAVGLVMRVVKKHKNNDDSEDDLS
jgi:hypothetical protein